MDSLEHLIQKKIELLRTESETAPYECDADSYSQGIHRAIAELENLLDCIKQPKWPRC